MINTFEELEADALVALRKDNAPVEIYAVGTLLPDSYFTTLAENTENVGNGSTTTVELSSYPMPALWKSDDKCVEWLNSQDPGSVMYVSFGSIAIMSGEQFEELALGLEESRSPMLWVIFDTAAGTRT